MDFNKFSKPQIEFAPRPLWFWNDKPDKDTLSEILVNSKNITFYGGFGILPYSDCKLEYMSEEYLQMYEHVLNEAEKNGLKMCLYDEWWFPSGSAGGLLKRKYPQCCAKRLDKIEYEVTKKVDITLPKDKIMSVTAINTDTCQIIDLFEYISGDRLVWETEEDNWKIMICTYVQSDWDRVNYLEPNSVRKFIEITHQVYYDRFSKYFGNVIDSSFYDEPQFYSVDGRMWTEDFNEKFFERYGFSPVKLYPALWYDIGETTNHARNMMFGLRADLYSNGFPKVIQEWCTEHGINLTGHVDQEEVINPVGITGDLMKSFKYQNIPGYDQIFHCGRAKKIIKLISSSAYNWDKPLVMSECFGAFPDSLTISEMYSEVMEQFSKGMNLLVPHAIWLNDSEDKIIFKPEFSYRNSKYKDDLSKFNKYCSRVSYILQGGRHVADIAVLYPIQGLMSAYNFSWDGAPHLGGPTRDEFDYQDVGEILFSQIRRDFTFIHPEVFDNQCSLNGCEIFLNNKNNFETYKIIIIPGTDTMSISNAVKLKEFYDNGGIIIATSMLPTKSVELNKDDLICEIMDSIFALNENCDNYKKNQSGGRAYFIKEPSKQALKRVLNEVQIEFDIEINIHNHDDDCVTYIHKIKDGRDIYYIANCGDKVSELDISINDCKQYELLNPHNGRRAALDSHIQNGRLKFKVNIPKYSSIILVSV